MPNLIDRVREWIYKRKFDAYARSLGYKNWKEYVHKAILLEEE